MSLPSPHYPLEHHCTAIWNNTLYVYSPEGFQSLSLTKGAKWQTLDSGVSVTGAMCAPALISGNEALYIVGGTTNGSAAVSSYAGLQRFDFAARSWESITPSTSVTQNRVNHGAAFINSANSILVFSGSQGSANDGSSTQTFLIATTPPYNVLSFNSQGAPALTSPMLMPWGEDEAVVVGGSSDNTQVWLFGQSQGWTNLGATLPAGLGLSSPTVQCAIISGADGSKVLEIYNLGVSPNTITSYVLFENNAVAPEGQQVGAATTTAKSAATGTARRRRALSRRALTLADWPAYNSSLAPSSTRSGFSLAVRGDGLSVMSGGGSSDDPIAIFDQTSNSWINATAMLVKQQKPLKPTSSSLSSTSSSSVAATTSQPTTSSITSSAPSSSATSNVLGTGQSKSKVLTTLGATLGAIFGLAAILIIILMLLRWQKQKKKRAAGGTNEKADRLSFADQGADFMKEAVGTRVRGSSQSKSANSSLTSLQIFQNKSIGHRRGMPSDSSQVPLAKNKSPLGVSDPVEMSQISQRSSPTFTTKSMKSIEFEKDISPPKTAELTPAAAVATKGNKDERSRSNGWSRYFANNELTNLASMQGGGRNTYNTEGTDMSRSDYNDDRRSEGPLELNLGPRFEGQRLSQVASGSPTMGQSHDDIHKGLKAEIRRAESTSSRGSDPGIFDSGNPTPGTQTTWTSRSGQSDKKADTRSISSNYSNSNPFFGSGGTVDPRERKLSSGAPVKPQLNLRNYGDATRDSQSSAVTVFPSGLDSPKGAAFPSRAHAPISRNDTANEYFPPPRNYFADQNRDSQASNVTVFPGVPAPTPASNFGVTNTASAKRSDRANDSKPAAGEDLGWLNLNAGKGI